MHGSLQPLQGACVGYAWQPTAAALGAVQEKSVDSSHTAHTAHKAHTRHTRQTQHTWHTRHTRHTRGTHAVHNTAWATTMQAGKVKGNRRTQNTAQHSGNNAHRIPNTTHHTPHTAHPTLSIRCRSLASWADQLRPEAAATLRACAEWTKESFSLVAMLSLAPARAAAPSRWLRCRCACAQAIPPCSPSW
jgi:hypothetical protein